MTFYMKRKKDEGAEQQMTLLFGSSLFMLTLILNCIMLFCFLFCFVFTETDIHRQSLPQSILEKKNVILSCNNILLFGSVIY